MGKYVKATLLLFIVVQAVPSLAQSADEARPVYVVKRATATPALTGQWDSPAWSAANTLKVSHFFPSEQNAGVSDHRPKTEARVLYDDKGVYVHFFVHDQYVRCIETEYHGKVWEDAAVEFFVQPKADRGYFNCEINCGGTMLLSYHENPDYTGPATTREGGTVPWDLAQQVTIYHSMPKTVDPEIADPVTWQIEYFIPFSLLEQYVGPLGDVAGQEWRANFYKIATNNSHPHYGAWSPILEGASFHAPQFFGVLKFAEEGNLRVMTFNVLVDLQMDASVPAWDQRKDLCAQVVKEVNPDLLGLQETSPNQLTFFRNLMTGYGSVGELPLSPEDQAFLYEKFPPLKALGMTTYTDVILFYRDEIFEKLDSGYIWLSPTPDKISVGFGNGFPRMMIWAKLRHKPSGREMMVAVTHFDNTEPSQQHMAKLSHETLQPFVDAGLPILFMGDFNTSPTRGDYPTLTSGGWKDSYLVNPKASEDGNDSNVPTAGSSRIDHIFYHGDAFIPKTWERIDSPDPTKELSDHHPVLATFDLR